MTIENRTPISQYPIHKNDKAMNVLVLGATTNPTRTAYQAAERLVAAGHQIFPIGIKSGVVAGIPIIHGTPDLENIHTVTLYLNPQLQEQYHDYIVSLQPQRVIFNPGTEHPAFANRLRQLGIVAEFACTLVMLSVGTFQEQTTRRD